MAETPATDSRGPGSKIVTGANALGVLSAIVSIERRHRAATNGRAAVLPVFVQVDDHLSTDQLHDVALGRHGETGDILRPNDVVLGLERAGGAVDEAERDALRHRRGSPAIRRNRRRSPSRGRSRPRPQAAFRERAS